MEGIKARSARRRTAAYALEVLEGRALLSHVSPAAAISGIHAEATKVISTITGTIGGNSAPSPTQTTVSYGYHGFSGYGSSSIGQLLVGFKYVSTPTTAKPAISNLTSGSGLLTTLKGKEIDLVFTGTATEKNGSASVTNLSGNVVSGTGIYDGATGTFSATGTTHPNGKFSLSFKIVLNPPVTS